VGEGLGGEGFRHYILLSSITHQRRIFGQSSLVSPHKSVRQARLILS
jgi:hypothetical protein